MAANTPTLNRFSPVRREGAPQYIYPSSQWCDNLVLVAGTAKSYTLPTGTNPRGGTVSATGPAGTAVTGTIFRIVANGGVVWMNTNGGTAAAPTADKTDGSGSVLIPADNEYWLIEPVNGQPLSFYADTVVSLSIEVWY